MSKPIPRLTAEMMQPPKFGAVKPKQKVAGPKPAQHTISAVASATAPQPHSWADQVEKTVAGMESAAVSSASLEPSASIAAGTSPSEATPATISWSQRASQSKPVSAPMAHVAMKAPTPPASSAKPKRTLRSQAVVDDFDEIMRYVDKMNWSGSHGPSCRIKTKIDWKDRDCRNLYLYVKDRLHNKPFKVGKYKTLYFYVGAIGNWGKAGFRITGHSKPVAKIENSKTNGVLHIEN